MRIHTKTICFLTLVLFVGSYHPSRASDNDSNVPSKDKPGTLSKQELDNLKKLDSEIIEIKAPRMPSDDESTCLAQSLKVTDSNSRLQTVTEVINDAVGVRVRTLGGLGSYGAASIRGSTPNQVPIYLDGVLLNAGGFDTVNLGDLSLDLLDKITIYRSGAPSSLGTVGIGGAIQLRTRAMDRSHWEGAISAGSNNTYRLMAVGTSSIGSSKRRFLALASLSGSSGDFLFFDNMGTRFNTEDDRIRHRSNNAYSSFSGLLKVNTYEWGWHWNILENFFIKTQGVPGMQNTTTKHASLLTSRNALALQATYTSEAGWLLKPDVNYLYLSEEMDDSHGAHGELGAGRQHTTTTTHALSCGAMLQVEETRKHFSTVRADFRYERLSQADLLNAVETGARHRLRGALALQHQWTVADELSVLPSARIEYIQSVFSDGTTPGVVAHQSSKKTTDTPWQLAMGAKWNVLENISVVANFGRYVRPPTLGELFGYRGTVVGNPDLEPESGLKSDLGVLLSKKNLGPVHQAQLQLAGFGTWTRNLITYWQNSQNTVKAQNIDAARILGVELDTSVQIWTFLKIIANYTLLDSQNRSDTPFYLGKALPGRPRHELYAKLELLNEAPKWSGSLWTDMSYTSQNYLDPSNMKDAGQRAIVGLGFRISNPRHGLSLTLEIKNLLNTTTVTTMDGYKRALEDYEGFPLPGRTIMATIRWKAQAGGDGS